MYICVCVGYDVLYSAFNGIHMPSVMPYTVGVMSLTERVMIYRVDEMAVLTGFKPGIEFG